MQVVGRKRLVGGGGVAWEVVSGLWKLAELSGVRVASTMVTGGSIKSICTMKIQTD
jgi:hypothetical protein